MTIAERRLRWRVRKAAQRATAPTQCKRCKTTDGPIDRHHPSLVRPLRVVALCRPCHAAVHMRRGDHGSQVRWAA